MPPDDRQLNLPQREEKILEFWERNKIFAKTLAKTEKGKPFIFYEGPPYANGLPGIHHFEARVFKDIIIRYRTMRGFFVPRKAGWDTHGLPVEMAVEKKLGIKAKRNIEEKIGIARFVEEARANVFFYKEEWEKFTRRIGYWLDLEHAYLTMSTDYIETLWWVIKEIWKKKLLYQDFKVVPWCPRCETPLSSHELGQGYERVKDRSVYVRFRVKAKTREWANTSILSWTTTPWTLPGNVALAVNPQENYVTIPDPEVKGQWLILGEKPFRQLVEKQLFPAEYRSSLMLDDIDTFAGKKLVGLEYEPLFEMPALHSQKSYHVYPADFVTMEEGTGVVHTAVMYGEDDYELGKRVGLPAVHTVDESGRFGASLDEGLGGEFVKDPKTEEKIIASLKRRGLLYKEELYEHDYPFCWRCDTPLLYYARHAWWVKVSAKRKALIANNEKINWVPEHIKHGRFGEFLKEARDWAFSRERYWGTPLPVWQCEKCKQETVIGSLEELALHAPASGNRYLALRHGQSEVQLLGVADDDTKSFHLTPRGREEVLAAVKQLKKEGIDLIIASPVLRTQETAGIIAEALSVKATTDDRLREIHIGAFEHKPVRLYHEYYASDLEKFTKRPPEGESLNDLKERLMAFMADLEKKHRGKTILLVSHEYPIWVLWGASQGLSNEAMVEAKAAKRGDFIATARVLDIPFRSLPRNAAGDVDLHRPFVDDFKLVCPTCRGEMRRIPEVADVWFDSGAMPFAQGHWPFAQSQKPKVKSQKLLFPADYICEGVDQTRGWFYTLLVVSTLLGRGPSYRNVISLGHVLDKNGQKMSKSRGNVVDPNAMIERYGTDAIRWYFYTVNAPGDPKRFDEQDVLLRLRGALSTLWNSFVFFDTYVTKIQNSKFKIQNVGNALDRWMMAKLDELTNEVTERLDGYDIVGAARALDRFIVEDFSNWYIRRSRRRLQRPISQGDYTAAARTAGHALARLSELMAPFTPFLAEIVYRELKPKLALTEESVHLRAWPKPEARSPKPEARTLLREMAEVRRLSALALAERARAGIKVRQPLAELKIKSLKLKVHGLLDVLKEEVNVKEVAVDTEIALDTALDTAITPELGEEGLMRELVRNIQEMRRDGGLRPQEKITIRVSGGAAAAMAERWRAFVLREAGAGALEIGGKKTVFAVEREVTLAGEQALVGIRKA